MVQKSSLHPGWDEGWAVVKGAPNEWAVAGIFETKAEAVAACTAKGDGYTVRWGSFYPETGDFVTGDPD